MPSNIDFLLDALLVDENYIDTGGNTEPSIIDGLIGNVTFKPWTGFWRLIKDANDVVERLSDEQVRETDISLGRARWFIKMKRRSHMMSVKTEEQRKALYEATAPEKSTNCARTSDVKSKVVGGSPIKESSEIAAGPPDISNASNTPGMREVETKTDESASKKPRVEPWHVRKPVTSTLSIADLHSLVTGALQGLLLFMYPEENFFLDERLISSENMAAGASEQMIEKYMRGLVKKMKEQRAAGDDLQKEKHSGENTTQNKDGRGTRGRESSEGEECQPLRRSPRLQKRRENEKKGPSLSDSDDSDWIPKKPVMPVNQTPDRCLFHISLGDPGVIPVCCYEFKAPTLDLTGLSSSEKVIHSSTTGGNTPEIISHENTTTFDGQHQPMAGFSDPNIGGTANIAIAEVQEAEDDIYIPQEAEDDIYIPGCSARAIAKQYNNLFFDTNDSAAKGENGKLLLLPIAQVICQALLSRTGCVFLTNHQTTFALRVEEDGQPDSFGATVYVTGAIPCNKEPGQFAAMLGFTKYCVDTLLSQENNPDEMLNPMRRLLMSLSYAAYSVDKVTEPLDPDWCPGGESSGHAEGNNPQRGFRREASHFQGTQAAKIASAVTTQVDDCVLRYEHCEDGEVYAVDSSTLTSSSSENSASTVTKKTEQRSNILATCTNRPDQVWMNVSRLCSQLQKD